MDSDTPASDRPRHPLRQLPLRQLEHLADSMPQLVWTAGSDGVVDYYNSRLALYSGAAPLADGSWEWVPMLHEDDLAFTLARWERAVADVTTFSCEHRIRMADGRYRWHLSRSEPVEDPDTGEIRWYGTATDVHEQKVAEERLQSTLEQLQRLQGVTAALSAPLWSEGDVVDALLGEGLLAAGATGGAVLAVADDGDVEVLGATDGTGTGSADLAALLTGERTVVLEAPDASVRAVVPFPPALRVRGGLELRYPAGADLGPSRLAALRAVAELGAQALLRARAYQDEQRRADQAEALQALATALATSGTVEEVARAIARYAGRSAGTDFAVVGIPTDDRSRLRLVHAPGLDSDVAAVWSEVPVDDPTPLTDAFRDGRTVIVGDHDRDDRYPVTAEVTRRAGFSVTATLPARAQDGTVIGAIGFGWRRPVVVGDGVLPTLDTVVSLCAQAMHRAALFEAEQQRRNYTERVRNAVSALARALTVDEVAVAIVRRAALSLGATTAALFDVEEDSVRLRVGDGDHRLVEQWVVELAASDGSVVTACRTGEIAVDDRTIVMPLEGTRRSGAVVVLGFPAHTAWGTYRDRLTSLAAQWSQAFDRARLHDAEQAEHRRTEQLQQLTARLAGCARTAHVLEVVQVHLPEVFGLAAARLLLGRRGGRREAPDADDALIVPLSATDPEGDLLVVEGGRDLDPDRRRSVELFAVQCAQTLGRISSQEREHEIATQLQHALLGDVDRIPGLAVGTVYLASEAGLDIGGDWYDVVHRDERTAVLVIGDVVGHSLSAATAMGQLRSAVRALAHLCEDPETLLERVIAYSENVREARYSTLALVHLDVPTGRFRYVCAGHPPLLVVDERGGCTFLEEGRNPPLAAFATTEIRAADGAIPPGGLLVLYTDGLIEHRGRSIDEGLEQVCEVAGPLRDLPPELFAAHLTDGVFSRVAARDDVAVLAVSPLVDPHLDVAFPASPTRLAGVRAQMRAWLREQGAREDEVADVLLLAGESLANAVEHAYHGRSPGLVEVRLECSAREVRLTVSDEGGWRTPHAPGKRGRGTAIMRSLADELIVSRSPGQQGTTLHARVVRRADARVG